jgi:hypothetical protein
MRKMALSAVLAFTVFGLARAQDKAPRPSRQEMTGLLAEHLKETTPAAGLEEGKPPIIPTDLGGPGKPKQPGEEVSRFDEKYGKLKVILLDDKLHGSIRDGRSLWGLTEALVYWPSNDDKPIIVPRGFVTDLASIPRPLWSWLPPDGPWAKAAVIHDFLYFTQGKGVLIFPRSNEKSDWTCRDTTLQKLYTKEDADWILRDAQKDRQVDVVSRNLIWLGVHVGGGNGWDNSPGTKDYGKCRTPPKLPPGATP